MSGPFFDTATVAAVRSDPNAIVAAYSSYKESFTAALGAGFAVLPEDYYKLAFCAQLAFEVAPYGNSTALTLGDLLDEDFLDCDNYAILAWQLYEILNPAGIAHVAMTGWLGAPVANHANLVIMMAGYDAMVIDPTIAHYALTPALNEKLSNVGISAQDQVSLFYQRAEGADLTWFRGKVTTALTNGDYDLGNLLYWFDSPDAYIQYGVSSLNWTTPQAEYANGLSPGWTGADASGGAAPGVTASGYAGGFFTASQLDGVLHDPASIAALYADVRNAFIAALPAAYASLAEDNLKLLFASVLAHELKPLGPGGALAFDDLLNSTDLDAAGFALLAHHLYEHLAPNAASDVDLVFWYGGSAQLLIQGGGLVATIVDASLGVAALVSLESLAAGQPVATGDTFDFYVRGDADAAHDQALANAQAGLYRSGQFLALFDNPEAYATLGIGVQTPTPGADMLNGFNADSGVDVLLLDALMAGVGDASNNVLVGTTGADRLWGGPGADTLTGHAGDDRLFGGHGDDVIEGGANDDRIDGGDGVDTVSFANDAAITVSLAVATAQDTGGAGIDTITGVENVVGSAFDDTITGDDQANLFAGLGGADILIGGAGVDTVSYANDAAVTVSLAIVTAQDTGGAGIDTITGFENIVGSAFDDTIAGDDQANVLFGLGGADILTGGDGIDTVSYANDMAVTVSLAIATAQDTGGAGVDTIAGFENVIGSAFDDIITGDDQANVLTGLDGADQLDGGAGDDDLFGGRGDDIFVVDSYADVVIELIGEGVDWIWTTLGDWLMPIEVENLLLLGDAAINATGTILGNWLVGNSAANTLIGGQGDDVLQGKGGKDLLTGGGGLDTFVFTSLADSAVVFAGRDAINTFAHGDKIDLSAIDANINVAGDQAFIWSPGGLTGVAGQLTVQQNAARSWTVWADLNGDGHADFALNIYGSPALNNGIFAWDFIL